MPVSEAPSIFCNPLPESVADNFMTIITHTLPRRPSILFITPASPFSSRSGAEQRSLLMYNALSQCGDVDVLQLAEGTPAQAPTRTAIPTGTLVAVQVQPQANVLGRYRPKPGLTHETEVAFGRKLASYDLIVGRYLWPICQLVIPDSTKTIVDLDGFTYRYSPETPLSLPLLLERAKKTVAHHLAKRELGRFSAAYLVSELDRVEVQKMPTILLPNIPLTIKDNAGPRHDGKNVLFVGSFWYRPNADGVNWFLSKVWPPIMAAKPDANLTLAGTAPEGTRRQWELHPNVSAPGFVTDLDRAYAEANDVIIPIHSGGGSNIKVLENLGHRRPCVATPFTTKAFGPTLRADEHLLLADSAKKFADYVIEVIRKSNAYEAMAERGYSLVAANFSPAMFSEKVIHLIQQVTGTLHPTQVGRNEP